MGLDYEEEKYDEQGDPATDELLEASVEALAGRQLAVEDILAKIILALYRLAEAGEHDRVWTENILDVLLVAVIDSAEGSVYGTAYTTVFDRVRSLVELYQDVPPDDE